MWNLVRWTLLPAVVVLGLSLGSAQEAQAQHYVYGFSPYGVYGSYYGTPGYPYAYSISPFSPLVSYPRYSAPYYSSYPTSTYYRGRSSSYYHGGGYSNSRYCR